MRYRVLQPIYVPPGVALTLDAAQARARAPWLRSLGSAGRFESTGMLCFKAGEVLGIAGDTPRALAVRLEPVDDPLQPHRHAAPCGAPPAAWMQAQPAATLATAPTAPALAPGAAPATPASGAEPARPQAPRARRLRPAGA